MLNRMTEMYSRSQQINLNDETDPKGESIDTRSLIF